MPRFRNGVPGVTIPLVWIDIEAHPDPSQYQQQWELPMSNNNLKREVSQTLSMAKISGYDLTECKAEVIADELKETGSHIFYTMPMDELTEYCQQWKTDQLCRK